MEEIPKKLTCAAASRAFIELMGSDGSSADKGIPAACAAANKAALLAEAAVALDDDDGRDLDLGGPVNGEARAVSIADLPLFSPQ